MQAMLILSLIYVLLLKFEFSNATHSETKNEAEFTICSLNCWALPLWLSEDKNFRLIKLIEHLAMDSSSRNVVHYDVIVLQELWLESDYKMIAKNEGIRKNYPHIYYFRSGKLLGSGLCVLSRHPFIEKHQMSFTLNGYPHHLGTGEWYAEKGIGLAIIRIGALKIGIYTTHTIADYSTPKNIHDQYKVHRLAQFFEIGQFIREQSARNSIDFIVLAGDLNVERESLEFKLMTAMTNLVEIEHEPDAMDSPTYGRSDNVYSSVYEAKRIDYILYRPTNSVGVSSSTFGFAFNKIPNNANNFSDHVGVWAKFGLTITVLQTGDGQMLQNETQHKSSISNRNVAIMQRFFDEVFEMIENYQLESCKIPIICNIFGDGPKLAQIERAMRAFKIA